MKGYCLIEYASLKEAKRAIEEMDGVEFMEQNLNVDWAFLKGLSLPVGRTPIYFFARASFVLCKLTR